MNNSKPITKEEMASIAALIGTEGWRIYERWIEDAKQTAIGRCVEAPADQRYYQGIATGVCEITKFIAELKAFASQQSGGT